MSFNKNIHHRRSIRLDGYDYASQGLYFITVCVNKKECLFGDIADGKMVLNNAGEMIEKWLNKIPEKFADIEIDVFQIMPNHLHLIVANVGAHPCVRPESGEILGEHIGSNLNQPILGEHMGSPLHRVVQWFKTMATNEYIRNVKSNNWTPFEKKLFQRNYYEHIIRNAESYETIKNYILNNPSNWINDQLYSEK